MGKIVHTSHIKIIQDTPPMRRAFIEDFKEPFYYGVHSGIAKFYGLEPKGEYPATLDHMIGAVGGWLTGTFAGALYARKITAFPENLTSTVEGDIEESDKTIKITEIRIKYHVTIPRDKEEEARRALEVHPASCPAYQSVKDAIQINIDVEFDLVD